MQPPTPSAEMQFHILPRTGLPAIRLSGRCAAEAKGYGILKSCHEMLDAVGAARCFFNLAVYKAEGTTSYVAHVQLYMCRAAEEAADLLYATTLQADDLSKLTDLLFNWWTPEHALACLPRWHQDPAGAVQTLRHVYLMTLSQLFNHGANQYFFAPTAMVGMA